MTTVAVAWQRTRAALRVGARADVRLVAAGILLFQFLLFSASWREFFCGDSIFYLARIVDSGQLRYLFTHMDSQGAYRPIGYLINSWIFFPLFGRNPLGYHVAMGLMHLGVCVLAWRLFRAVLTAEAAVVALFFFAFHSAHFYPTFDTSFLPDTGMMLCWLASLLAWQQYAQTGRARWVVASLAAFVLGLLNKETIITLPATLLLWDVILRIRAGSVRKLTDYLRIRPLIALFFLVDALYLAWILRIKHGLLYPGGVYGATTSAEHLVRKREYLFWLFNIPTDYENGGWLPLLVLLAAIPVTLWLWHQIASAWPRAKGQLLACGLWLLAPLSPLLIVTQAPMKHHLYMPVVAGALAIGIAVERMARRGLGPMARAHAWVAALVVLAIAAQVQWDLRYSWASQGSRITQASLEGLQSAYPRLPHNALLYVLPTTVRGTVSWYFDNGNLFRVFYNDPSLRTAYADHGDRLPAGFAERKDVFVLRFHNLRLYDATGEYKAEHHPGTTPLVQTWRAVVAHRDAARDALVVQPGAETRLAAATIAPETVLQVGVSRASGQGALAAQLYFESVGHRELVLGINVDPKEASSEWLDSNIALDRWAGRAGHFVLSVPSTRGASPVAWSRLRIVPAGYRAPGPVLAGARTYSVQGQRLLDSFDTSRVTPAGPRADTPTGTAAFPYTIERDGTSQMALVTIAGAQVRFPLDGLTRDSALKASLAPALAVGDGTNARVYIEDARGRHLLAERAVAPHQNGWQTLSLPLGDYAGRSVTLVLECDPGPKRDSTGDWLAWGKLRVQ